MSAATWADELLDTVDPRPGERVLDIASGTDVVARRAVDRVLPGGTVAEWREREASSLPFATASFDVVVCQQRLQLLPDRGRTLSEVRRVLAPGGRVGVSVWGPIERSPAFAALADALERHAGVRTASAVRWLFSLSEADDLRALLADADLARIRVRTARRTTRFASVAAFLHRYDPGPVAGPWIEPMSEQGRRRVVSDLEAGLAPWIDGGGLMVTTEVNIGVARHLPDLLESGPVRSRQSFAS
ncbi:MAG TPA: methyltransferase domain-containing protein [Actinomycetota bacterium]